MDNWAWRGQTHPVAAREPTQGGQGEMHAEEIRLAAESGAWTLEEHLAALRNERPRVFWLGFTLALLVHALLIIGIGRSSNRTLGKEDGASDAIAVEIVDGATLKDSMAPPAPPAAAPPAQQPQQQQQPPQPAQPEVPPTPPTPPEVAEAQPPPPPPRRGSTAEGDAARKISGTGAAGGFRRYPGGAAGNAARSGKAAEDAGAAERSAQAGGNTGREAAATQASGAEATAAGQAKAEAAAEADADLGARSLRAER